MLVRPWFEPATHGSPVPTQPTGRRIASAMQFIVTAENNTATAVQSFIENPEHIQGGSLRCQVSTLRQSFSQSSMKETKKSEECWVSECHIF